MRLVVLGPLVRGSWSLTLPVPPQLGQSSFAMCLVLGFFRVVGVVWWPVPGAGFVGV